jgi:hypothetical protein
MGKYKEKLKEWYKRHGIIQISANGKIDMDFMTYSELNRGIDEAFKVMKTLEEWESDQMRERYPNGIMLEFK